jgi:hypothetical protein
MTQISRYSLTLIVAAAIIIEVLGAAQYFMARSGARNELLAKAQRDMQESQRVAMVKTEVETALKNAEHSIHLTLGTPETSYSIASRIIQVNPHIIGVGVAFIPNYYKDKGRNGLFLPYTYDDQPSIASKGKRTGKPHIRTHIPSLDYTQRDWYKTAMAGQRQWTEAYVGEGGLSVLMCTYSIPVTDKSGRIVGVLFADVTMEDATVMMSKLNHGIRKSGIVTLGIQLVSFLLLSFIIWRAVVASRRYKERYVDPEKTHLIEQVEKMRQVNTRLTKRNQELAQRVAEMQARLNSQVQQRSDQHWFG